MRAQRQHLSSAPELGVTSTTRWRAPVAPQRAPRSASTVRPRRRSACLDAETALALADGRASASRWDELDAHLDTCPACFRLAAHALHALHPALASASGPHEPTASLTPGTVLAGRFTVQAFVGRGGMGEVYRALDEERGEMVAVKIVVATASDDPRAHEQLLGEARTMSGIEHPNLCRVLGAHVHEAPGEPPLAFSSLEYLPGATLRARLRRGALDVAFATCIARQLARALGALHAHGVLHLDVKPDNVMVHTGADGAPHVTLFDFGLARRFTAGSSARRPSPGLAGSAGYMAPEQRTGGVLGVYTDVFAFGVTLFELLTRRSPFHRSESGRAGAADRDVRAPSTFVCGLPGALDTIVERCSKYATNERYASVDALLADLDRAAT